MPKLIKALTVIQVKRLSAPWMHGCWNSAGFDAGHQNFRGKGEVSQNPQLAPEDQILVWVDIMV